VSWSWLQNHVNNKFSQVHRQVKVTEKTKGKLIIECDELWSFVFSKKNQGIVIPGKNETFSPTETLIGFDFNHLDLN
jgi:hypothetical protein